MGKQQRGVLRQVFRRELIFMHEIEQEAAFEQGVVHPVHVLPHERSARRLVEQVRPLAHHHAQIGDRALIDEVGVVLGHPVEIFVRRLQPAAVLPHSVLAADDVVIRHHARGQRLVKPHPFFLLRLVDVAPAGRPVDHAAVTLVAILPFCTALQTRPCSAHPQIGVSSPPRPWLSHWNHSQISPSCTRLAVERMPPPRLAK